MENVVFKYSDFFDDDGGFQKIRKDFDQLGDDLIAKAKEVREQTKFFDIENGDQIKEAEKQAESLTDAFKEYGKAKQKIVDIEEEFIKAKQKEVETTDDQLKALTKLDKALQTQRTNLKELNKLGTIEGKRVADVNAERVKAELAIKQITKQIRDQQSEILKSNELSKDEQKLLKAKLVLDKEQVRTLNDVRERMKALRIVVQSLDIESQADQIQDYNKEIDELTEVLSDNSDKFIQSKINIGNYEESIVNALKSSELFKTNIGAIDGVLQSMLGFLVLSKEELDAMAKSADANTNAIKRMTIAFGRLNKVLKASIIGAVLVAVGALASAFGNTRAGAIRTEKVMKTLSTTFTTFGQVARIILDEVTGAFKSLTEFLRNPFKKQQQKSAKDTESAWKRIQQAIQSGTEAVIEGLDNIDRAFKLEDRVKRLTQEIEVLNGVLAITNSIADDSTKSLATQLTASQKALGLTEEVGKRQLEIARLRLQIANERVKQNIKANVVEKDNIDLSLQGESFAKATLNLAQQRGSQLEIANDLIDEQQNALLDVIKTENELNLSREENARKQREIQRDLFEQNLDLLIDLIDTEKNISEQYVNDITRNFQSRVNEFNRFLIKFRQTSERELDEFNKLAVTSAKLAKDELDRIEPSSDFGKEQIQALKEQIKQLENIDFTITYDDNGDFEVFNNGVELALDDIVELNKQLQALGIAEIPINRFREFVIETRNGVRDFRLLNKELDNTAIRVKQLSEDVFVTQDEINALTALEDKITRLIVLQRSATSAKELDAIKKQIIELEEQKTAITEFAVRQRLENRRDAIDDELKLVEKESTRYYELLQERLNIEKQIREKDADEALKKTKETNEKQIEEFQDFQRQVEEVLTQVLDKVVEVNEKRVEEAQKQADRQEEIIDTQRRRAEQGLTNTLAFEQRELAKREAEIIKRQKRQERLEKIRALYSSYNNYSSQGEQNPILKALKDFAILEAISASFKEGGIVGSDQIKTNRHGVTVGKSHDRDGMGGNLAWFERGEGFFPKKAVDNIGHANFYKLKEMAVAGNIDENFFTRQRQAFIKVVPSIQTDPRVVEELKNVKSAIDNKPVSTTDVGKITETTMEIVETILLKNKKTRNIRPIKKPRI